MVTKNQIIDAYLFLRKNNQSIPDEVLDFIKESAIEKLNAINEKPKGWINNLPD